MLLRALERFTRPKIEHDQCELCALALESKHDHIVDLESRTIRCACRACAITLDGSARYRPIPRDARRAEASLFDAASWQTIGVPVGVAFVFRRGETWVATFPSPAGPTEAELSEDAIAILASSPFVRAIAPDVQALLVRRHRDGRIDAWSAPIDACYRLVALVRSMWRGFDGGDEVRRAVDEFFEELAK